MQPACHVESLLLDISVYPAFVRPRGKKNEKDNSFRQSSFVDILVNACLLDA